MSCAVGSCSHGTTESVEKSGSSSTSWSALSFSKAPSSVGQSPAIVWVKIEPGIDMVGAARNFATGMILPRATPAWSGTTHSISSMCRWESHARASSSVATPRVRSAALIVFFFATIHLSLNRKTAGNLAGSGYVHGHKRRYWLDCAPETGPAATARPPLSEITTGRSETGCRRLGSTLTWRQEGAIAYRSEDGTVRRRRFPMRSLVMRLLPGLAAGVATVAVAPALADDKVVNIYNW